MLEDKLKDNTAIDAGHYSYASGPSELDIHLWEEGVKLYSFAKERYKHIALCLFVDDMRGAGSNDRRRSWSIHKMPEEYSKILLKYHVENNEVIIISQDRVKEKGRQLLRQKGKSRKCVPICRLIVAAEIRQLERRGFQNYIGFYEYEKTDCGRALGYGCMYSRMLFNTRIDCHYILFKNKREHQYIFHSVLST